MVSTSTLSFKSIRWLCKVKNVDKVVIPPSFSVLVWDRLWKPGLKPVTEEEHKKAAEKYGLHPSEYKPYEDSLGDYPRLPKIGAEAKDPFYPYDFPVLRRNFGDPVCIKKQSCLNFNCFMIIFILEYTKWFNWNNFFSISWITKMYRKLSEYYVINV